MNPIVMPVYNNLALTREAVRSCLAQDIGDVRELVVVDKGDDGVLPWLRTQPVDVISLPQCGVTKAWNTALTSIFGGLRLPHALVVNNDIKLRPDAYRLLVEDGGQFVTCVGTSSGAEWPGGQPLPSRKRPHPDFSCFLIRRECWQKVGSFDPSLRIYTSDGDYHLRMHKAGVTAYCLDLPFWHAASATLKNADAPERDRILKIAGEDREAFARKWGFTMGSDEYYQAFADAT